MATVLQFGARRLVTRINLRALTAAHQNLKCYATQDTVTHTGQVWDNKDYRHSRFIDRDKEVNENFSINLIAEEPPTEVQGRTVHCDGGGGALGHPRVYINLDPEGPHACGYCGLRFIKTQGAH